jgi:hypothetical protein
MEDAILQEGRKELILGHKAQVLTKAKPNLMPSM